MAENPYYEGIFTRSQSCANAWQEGHDARDAEVEALTAARAILRDRWIDARNACSRAERERAALAKRVEELEAHTTSELCEKLSGGCSLCTPEERAVLEAMREHVSMHELLLTVKYGTGGVVFVFRAELARRAKEADRG